MTNQQKAEGAGCVRIEGPFETFTIDCPRAGRKPAHLGIYIKGDEAAAWDEAAYQAEQAEQEATK